MATTVVRTFNLYNTTFYWNGYSVASHDTEVGIAEAYYITQFSSNPIGSQIDFFTEFAGGSSVNLSFSLSGNTIYSLSYLWSKYWWDEAIYYSNSLVLSAISISKPSYYQPFSESVGSLYYISYYNNLNNTQTVPYNTLLECLLSPGISSAIKGFYTTANKLFTTNISNIGPKGTDTAPNNGNLIMADTDLNRRIVSNSQLYNTVNSTYPDLSAFLPFNNITIGNLIAPYGWYAELQYEDSSLSNNNTIFVDMSNRTLASQTQLTTITLSA